MTENQNIKQFFEKINRIDKCLGSLAKKMEKT